MNKYVVIFILIFCLPIYFNSCKKDIPELTDPDPGPIVEAIEVENFRIYWDSVVLSQEQFDVAACGLFIPPEPPHMDEPELIGEPVTTFTDGISCETTEYQWALGMQEAFLYNPTSDVFFLRNILDGSSIQTGEYKPIVAPQSPFTFSIGLENIGGNASATVANPTLANVREAVAQLLRQLAPSATPAQISSTIEQVYSKEHASVAIRGNFKGFGVRVNASYDWDNLEIKSRFLVNFTQIYYTIDTDITNTMASDFFDPEHLPSVDQFNENMPVYISSIKYGRQVVFAIESSYEASEVRAAIQASYNGILAGGGIDISAHHQEILTTSSISAFVMGGNGGVAGENIGDVSALGNIMMTGGNYSADSPGVPLAYTLRYLCDNSVAKIALASEYVVRECEDVGEQLTFRPFGDGEYPRLCPELIAGDDEFGGNGPIVDGNIRLYEQNNEIWASVLIDLRESNHETTHGRVAKFIHLFTIPNGKVFRGFVTLDNLYLYYVDSDHSPDSSEILVDGEFLSNLIINGDTSGDDIEDCVDDDSWVELTFAPITILVGNE